MPDRTAEVVVLGLGAMGAFACRELARRNVDVIGIDQFEPPHDRGSHSGETRTFRLACGEGLDYVPLAQRAAELWDRLSSEAGETFLHRTGLMRFGPQDHPVLNNTRKVAATFGLPLRELTREELIALYPVFALPVGSAAVLDLSAGWMDVNGALAFALMRARRLGADVLLNTAVTSWREDNGKFVLETQAGIVRARQLIVAAGAWAVHLLSSLNLPLKIFRKTILWIQPADPAPFQPGSFPLFAWTGRSIYGFPDFNGAGVKVALHENPNAPVVASPENPVSNPDSEEAELVLRATAELMPALVGPPPAGWDRVARTKACLYTVTPDENFVVDRHPAHRNLIYAAGFSGHGFKFAPAIGEALADYALTGKTPPLVAFLQRGKRF